MEICVEELMREHKKVSEKIINYIKYVLPKDYDSFFEEITQGTKKLFRLDVEIKVLNEAIRKYYHFDNPVNYSTDIVEKSKVLMKEILDVIYQCKMSFKYIGWTCLILSQNNNNDIDDTISVDDLTTIMLDYSKNVIESKDYKLYNQELLSSIGIYVINKCNVRAYKESCLKLIRKYFNYELVRSYLKETLARTRELVFSDVVEAKKIVMIE